MPEPIESQRPRVRAVRVVQSTSAGPRRGNSKGQTDRRE